MTWSRADFARRWQEAVAERRPMEPPATRAERAPHDPAAVVIDTNNRRAA